MYSNLKLIFLLRLFLIYQSKLNIFSDIFNLLKTYTYYLNPANSVF